MIEPHHKRLSVRRQCDLIGLPRSSYYREPKLETEENLDLMRMIDEEYTRHPFYGTPKMRDFLMRKGYKVNRKRVQRLMRLMGLESSEETDECSGQSTQDISVSFEGPGDQLFQSGLVQRYNVHTPERRLRLPDGGDGLVQPYVLSWEISVTMEESFCVSALERALRCYSPPEISIRTRGASIQGVRSPVS